MDDKIENGEVRVWGPDGRLRPEFHTTSHHTALISTWEREMWKLALEPGVTSWGGIFLIAFNEPLWLWKDGPGECWG